jgi:hypothetical protein
MMVMPSSEAGSIQACAFIKDGMSKNAETMSMMRFFMAKIL